MLTEPLRVKAAGLWCPSPWGANASVPLVMDLPVPRQWRRSSTGQHRGLASLPGRAKQLRTLSVQVMMTAEIQITAETFWWWCFWLFESGSSDPVSNPDWL